MNISEYANKLFEFLVIFHNSDLISFQMHVYKFYLAKDHRGIVMSASILICLLEIKNLENLSLVLHNTSISYDRTSSTLVQIWTITAV